MTQKIHNAQIEVWEWKETLYNELLNVPRQNWAEYLNNLAQKVIKEFKLLEKGEKNNLM